LRSWRIGSAFGIPVYVHPTFLLLPLWVMLANRGGGVAGSLFLSAMVVAVFACVLMHEFGHALMARRFGINTRDVTIYPIGGVARLEGMSEEPYQEVLIAIAGPAVNVVIAVLLIPVVVLGLLTNAVTADPLNVSLNDGIWPILAHAAAFLCFSNVILVVFNLIPAFPMDGGRVLRALLTIGLGFPRATTVAVHIGTVLAVVMGVVGFRMTPPNYMLSVVAVFVVLTGQQELLMVRYRERMKESQHRRTEMPPPGPILLPIHEPPPVGRAVEVNPPGPVEARRPAEPQLIFHFRVVEIPEPPR
jgi:Zn-dependent protease